MRNLRGGFYDLGGPGVDPCLPQSPRLVRTWDDLTLAVGHFEDQFVVDLHGER